MTPLRPRLLWLDYARFAAALSVMCFHYFYGGPRSENMSTVDSFETVAGIAEFGFLGVAFFFMISGFVIVNAAAHRTAREFAVSRIVRLYPAFVTCLCLTTAVSMFWGGPLMTVSADQFIANLAINAPMFGRDFADGVYWTLIFEVKFYLAVFLLIFLGLSHLLEKIFYAWIILLAWSETFGYQLPYLEAYFSLFAAGGLLAFIYQSGFNLIRTVLLALVASLTTWHAMERAKIDGHDEIIVGVISLCFYAVFLIFSAKPLANLQLPYARAIGALTYPLYLLHAHLGYMTMNHLASEENKWFVVTIVIVAMIGISHLIARYVEELPRPVWRKVADTTAGAVIGTAEELKSKIRFQNVFK